MFRQFCLLLLFCLSAKPFSAQTSPELVVDGIIGSPLQGQLTWLDDTRLLVGTSAETMLYDANSTQVIYTIPAGGNYFLMNDEIIVAGRRWDSATGELLGTSNIIKTWATESGNLRANLLNDGNVEIIAESVYELPIPETFTFSRIIFGHNGSSAVIIFQRALSRYYYEEIAQLWNLSNFEKIADLPNSAGLEYVAAVHFYQSGQRLAVSYGTNAVYGSIFAETAIWDTATGQRLNQVNMGYLSVRLSPDEQFLILVDSFRICLYSKLFGQKRSKK